MQKQTFYKDKRSILYKITTTNSTTYFNMCVIASYSQHSRCKFVGEVQLLNIMWPNMNSVSKKDAANPIFMHFPPSTQLISNMCCY